MKRSYFSVFISDMASAKMPSKAAGMTNTINMSAIRMCRICMVYGQKQLFQ